MLGFFIFQHVAVNYLKWHTLIDTISIFRLDISVISHIQLLVTIQNQQDDHTKRRLLMIIDL